MQNILSPTKFIDRDNPLSFHKLNIFFYSRFNALPIIHKKQGNYYNNINNREKNYINDFWKNFLITNSRAFNGNLARVDSVSAHEISVSFTDYKAFLSTSKFDFYKNNVEVVANPLTVTPIIITKDNKLVVGYRKSTKILQFPGGMVDFFKDGDDERLYIEKCAQREIEEELCNIETYDYKYLGASISLKDIFTTLYVYCRTNNTFDHILQTRNACKNDIVDFWEIPEIFAIDLNPDSLADSFRKNCTGTMYAGIMLLGRRLYGRKWYLQNVKNQFGGIYLDFNC